MNRPPVPPQSSSRSKCLYRVFKIICIILIYATIFLAFFFGASWLILKPNKLSAHVESASLTKFDLSNSDTLQYNLALKMSLRNYHTRVGIYYDYIEAQAYYDGSARFGFETLAPFFQDKWSRSYITPHFNGTQLMLGSSVGTTYEMEHGEGFYHVDLRIMIKIRLKTWGFMKKHMKAEIDCTLKLPVPGKTNGTSWKCGVNY